MRWLAAVSLVALLCGCQTTRSLDQGCPGVYSGVRYYIDQLPELPPDGRIFFTFDLPLTAVMDTLLLPITSFSDPKPPAEGWSPGCRWVRP